MTDWGGEIGVKGLHVSVYRDNRVEAEAFTDMGGVTCFELFPGEYVLNIDGVYSSVNISYDKPLDVTGDQVIKIRVGVDDEKTGERIAYFAEL